MDMHVNDDLPLACDLGALDDATRAAHLESARRLLGDGAAEVQELPDGYMFRYGAEQYAQIAQFITNERLCCPFFAFTLEVTPDQGPLWLRLTGGAGVKDFLTSAREGGV
jgi:hypothetical protein